MTDSPTEEEGIRAAGRVVLTRRGELGLTQQEVAARAGIDADTLGALENGKRWPWPRNVAAIARALDLDAAELQRVADGQPARAS